tara:strand:+ start:187 stop:408 length:222 start_codon:yes stop_codon:yes gene_type:complete
MENVTEEKTQKIKLTPEDIAKLQKPTLEQAKAEAFDTIKNIESLKSKLGQITAFIDAEEAKVETEAEKKQTIV